MSSWHIVNEIVSLKLRVCNSWATVLFYWIF